MKKDFLLIRNPHAGSEKCQQWVEVLENRLEKEGLSYDVHDSLYAGHTSEIAKKEAPNYGALIAIGGDGTVHEVAQGVLANEGAVLGILPIGSGNDYYRNFDKTVDPNLAIEKIISRKTGKVDVGLDDQGRYLLNIASVGLDSHTVMIQKKIKNKVPKKLEYILALLYSIGAYKKEKLQVKLDDKEFISNSALLCFGNGRVYGGGIGIMPWAQLDDGNLHVVNIIDIARPFIYLVAPTILFGKHIKIKRYVKVYEAKSIEVKGDNMLLNIDGELFNQDYIKMEILPKKLELIV